jgi:DNA polymerase-3 subunit delta
MVAIKANQAQGFLRTIESRITAILTYGPDAGLVAERAKDAAQKLAARDNPPGEVLRIEDADLDTDPDRIHVELQTVAMFGGAKVIRTSASRKVTAAFLKPLLEPGAIAGGLVVEAGNLRPDEALRKLFEGAATAAAIPCFADETRDIERLVREELSAEGLQIAPDALQMLVGRLGADRALFSTHTARSGSMSRTSTPRLETPRSWPSTPFCWRRPEETAAGPWWSSTGRCRRGRARRR